MRKHTGLLRHLLVREAKNTDDAMIAIFTSQPLENPQSFVDAIAQVYPQATILNAINGGLSDATNVDEIILLKGSGFITEKMFLDGRELSFRISPKSFFQTNTRSAEKLYLYVRKIIADLRPANVFDLYGGAGGFSLAVCDIAQRCFCVEAVTEAISDGKENAKLSCAHNIEFIRQKTEDFLTGAKISESDVIIADPPRAGFHPKALKAVMEANPKALIYISCNPQSLARDLKALAQSYKIYSSSGFDLFPHTEHVETAIFLKKL
ncbi:MAG: RsmD family RNA methyltransferase [Elusimicrobia bacterium]|nr:RsmD family RNA methyltransferase [Elusimicrobiota bacterium]